MVCIKNFDQSKLNNLRCYVPQSLCSFVAKARVKCQFQWLHFLSPNFSFFLITQQSTQWMQRKIACQNYTQKMDSIANSSRIAGDRRLTQSWVLNTYIFLWFVFPSQGYSKTSCFHMFHVKKSNLQHHHFLTFFAVFAWDRPAPLPQQPRFSCNFCRFLVQHREMINIFLRKRKKLPKAV